MYVCICNALKEREVRSLAQEARDRTTANGMVPGDMFKRLGARPKCGKCVSHAYDIFQDEQARILAATA